MEIMKLEHSGVAITKAGKVLVFDPVEIVGKLPELRNVVAVIITHKHGDHLQSEVLARILRDNPGAKVLAPEDAQSSLPDATVVKAGNVYEIGGFKLNFFGKDHAEIVPGQVPCENIGIVVDDLLVNPGDSFDLPSSPSAGMGVLLVAVAAPWLKIAEAVDFVMRARPKIVIPVHSALLSDFGMKVNGGWLRQACEDAGVKYADLMPGEAITV